MIKQRIALRFISRYLTFGVLFLFMFSYALSEAKELTEREVTTLITEYLKADTSSTRQNEILSELKTAKPILAQRILKTALADENQRPGVLKLATELRVPGLCEIVKKYIDTEDGDQCIAYMFVTQDRSALNFLFDIWVKADTESAIFGLISIGFESFSGCNINLLDKFYNQINDETRGERAKDILCFQLGIIGKDLSYLKSNWEKLRNEYIKFARTFSIAGQDLLLLPGLRETETGVRKVGPNYSIEKSGGLQINLSDSPQTGDFILKAMVYIGDGDDCKMEVYDTNGCFTIRIEKNEWVLATDAGLYGASLKRKDWNVIEWNVSAEKKAKKGEAKLMRNVKLFINGENVVKDGLLINDKIDCLKFYGECVVGGVELIKK